MPNIVEAGRAASRARPGRRESRFFNRLIGSGARTHPCQHERRVVELARAPSGCSGRPPDGAVQRPARGGGTMAASLAMLISSSLTRGQQDGVSAPRRSGARSRGEAPGRRARSDRRNAKTRLRGAAGSSSESRLHGAQPGLGQESVTAEAANVMDRGRSRRSRGRRSRPPNECSTGWTDRTETCRRCGRRSDRTGGEASCSHPSSDAHRSRRSRPR